MKGTGRHTKYENDKRIKNDRKHNRTTNNFLKHNLNISTNQISRLTGGISDGRRASVMFATLFSLCEMARFDGVLFDKRARSIEISFVFNSISTVWQINGELLCPFTIHSLSAFWTFWPFWSSFFRLSWLHCYSIIIWTEIERTNEWKSLLLHINELQMKTAT